MKLRANRQQSYSRRLANLEIKIQHCFCSYYALADLEHCSPLTTSCWSSHPPPSHPPSCTCLGLRPRLFGGGLVPGPPSASCRPARQRNRWHIKRTTHQGCQLCKAETRQALGTLTNTQDPSRSTTNSRSAPGRTLDSPLHTGLTPRPSSLHVQQPRFGGRVRMGGPSARHSVCQYAGTRTLSGVGSRGVTLVCTR